jgi:hypothetical protein
MAASHPALLEQGKEKHLETVINDTKGVRLTALCRVRGKFSFLGPFGVGYWPLSITI